MDDAVTRWIRLVAIISDCSAMDMEKIRHYVTASHDFTSGWNQGSAAFVHKIRPSANTLGKNLHALVPAVRFLLTEVNLAELPGQVAKPGCTWIEKRRLSPMPQTSSRV